MNGISEKKLLTIVKTSNGFYHWKDHNAICNCIMAVYQNKSTVTPMRDFHKIFYQNWLMNYKKDVETAISNFDYSMGTEEDLAIIKIVCKEMNLDYEVKI